MTRADIEAVFILYGCDIQDWPWWAVIDRLVDLDKEPSNDQG